MQCRDVLLQRILLYILHGFLGHCADNHVFARLFGLGKRQIRLAVSQNIKRIVFVFGIAERNLKRVTDSIDTGMTNLLITKDSPDFA